MAQQKAVVTTLKSPVQEDGSRFTLFPEPFLQPLCM